ncbi:MAG: hypothetical protein MR051_08550 [Lentisphaeria bacterium]|nr:hypothetical protein [Lentisphaeria bacterium]
MRKLLICLFAAGTLLAAAQHVIVRDGGATSEAFRNPNGWTATAGGLTGSGAGNPLWARRTFAPGEFTVTAELSIAAWCGGAPRITIGPVNCGFDGGASHEFFVETDQRVAKKLGKGSDFITPGQWFTLTIRGKNGQLTYAVNGRTLGEYDYPVSAPLTVGVNPWRATLTVKNLTIDATPAGTLGDVMPVPVCNRLLGIDRDGECALPLANFAPGSYPARLESTDGKKLVPETSVTIDGDRIAVIPKSALADAYARLGGELNTRVVLLRISVPGSDWSYRCRLVLTDPAKPAKPAEGRVVYRNGRGSFVVNGQEVGSFAGSSGLCVGRLATESLTRFGKAGVDGVVFYDSVGDFMDEKGGLDRERYARNLREKMTAIVGRNPNAHFKIFYHLYMPPAWCKAHPEESIRLDNGVETLANTPGKSLQPSYASALWRKQMGDVLAESVRIMRESPFADRIPYIRLCYGNCGEWNNFGYAEQAYVDVSKPMQRAFAGYLREKYRTAEALQKAWDRPDVTFDADDLVPTRENRWKGGDFVRANGAEGMPTVDYYEFFQKFAAETVIHFARIIKQASQGKMLAGAYFGYYFGHYGLNPFHFQDCGQYGVPYLLAAPEVDFYGGPYPYHLRRKSMTVNGVTGSLKLAGKIWESEHDERTHHSGERNKVNGTTDNLAESIAVGKRDIMLNLAAGSSFYYYDFVYDWYRDPEYMEMVAKMREIDTALRSREWKNPAKLAIIVSEKTVPYFTSRNDNKIIRQLNNFFNKELPFIGMPYDLFLTSDLGKIDFAQYDAVLFPNCTYADDKLIADVRRYAAGNGRKLVFFHSPGLINAKNLPDAAQSEKLTGIRIAFDPEKTVGTVTGKYGTTKLPPVRFRTMITDESAVVLGTWEDGAAAIAEKQFADWKSIVVCHHAPSMGMLRNLLNDNGVRFWSSGRAGLNQCSFAGPLLSMYSRNAGKQTFWLPEKVEIAVDLFTGEVLARNSSVVNFTSPEEPHTRIIFAGKTADYQQYFQKGSK